jgi:hypothetical protein
VLLNVGYGGSGFFDNYHGQFMKNGGAMALIVDFWLFSKVRHQ